MRISSNISSLNVYRHLKKSENRIAKSLERLSSGLRINRSADDVAGLSISERMRSQVKGLNQAIRNSQDGISLIQTAEGALNETHSILQRMRELTVQASNDTLTIIDRFEIQKEIDQLLMEIDRIANTTEFNRRKLLDGSTTALTSSDNIKTKVFFRDGLQEIEGLTRTSNVEGNYKMEIQTTPGQGQVLKSNILTSKAMMADSSGVLNNPNIIENSRAGVAEQRFYLSSVHPTEYLELELEIDGEKYVIRGEADWGSYPVHILIDSLIDAVEADEELSQLITIMHYPAYGFKIITKQSTPFNLKILDYNQFRDLTFEYKSSPAFDDFDYLIENGELVKDHLFVDQVITDFKIEDPDGFLPGDYEVYIKRTTSSSSSYVENVLEYSQSGKSLINEISVSDSTNQSVSMTVIDIDGDNIIFDASYVQPVSPQNSESGNIEGLSINSKEADQVFSVDKTDYTVTLNDLENFTVGDRLVINTAGRGSGFAPLQVEIHHKNSDNQAVNRHYFTSAVIPEIINLEFFMLDKETGETKKARIELTVNNFSSMSSNPSLLASAFTVTPQYSQTDYTVMVQEAGSTVNQHTRLNQINNFYDSSGNFLIEEPKTISLFQGDGKRASVAIYGSDTISEVIAKLNNAIHEGLGQKEFYSSTNHSYVQYVDPGQGSSGGFFSVEGTIVLQSALPGDIGKISFVADQEILNAFGFTEIQKATNSDYNINIVDAHSGNIVKENISTSHNIIIGGVNKNIDILFDPFAGIDILFQQDGAYKAFNWGSNLRTYLTYFHIADNTLVFHIGANSEQNIVASIADMRADALGVDSIIVMEREKAGQSMGKVDKAIIIVSSERSKLGSIQNRLEHTINNLSVSSTNLSNAESRIRDVDFALEFLELTKNKILSEAGIAILAKANLQPQIVLTLLAS